MADRLPPGPFQLRMSSRPGEPGEQVTNQLGEGAVPRHGDDLPGGADDGHIGAGPMGGLADQAVEPGRIVVLEALVGEHRESGSAAFEGRDGLLVKPARVADCERHLQRHDDQHREPHVAEEEPAFQPWDSRRNPTPRTVSIQEGPPSFRRSEATCTSMVLVVPNQTGSQACSSIS